MRFQPDSKPAPATSVLAANALDPAGVPASAAPGVALGKPQESASRVPVSASLPPPPVSAPSAAAPQKNALAPLRGKLLDDLGRGLVGIDVVLEGSAKNELARTRSTAGGAFEFEGEVKSGRILAADDAWCTVLCGVANADRRERTPIVVAARRLVLAGRIVDEMGVPLEHAVVSAPEPVGFRTRFQEVLDLSEGVHAQTRSDANGYFRLDAVPALEGARLSVLLEPFEAHEEDLPLVSQQNLLIALARTLALDGTLHGSVVDAQGAPVSGARVALGLATQTTDSAGSFVFLIDDPESMNARMGIPVRTLTAAKPGFLPASFEPQLSQGKPMWPANIVLRLGETALEIRGRVVDSRGDPMSGVRVFISEAGVLGGDQNGPIVLENYLAGAESGPLWRYTQSDAQGGFVLDGLAARDYRLRAMDQDTLLIAETEAVPAGSLGVEIELDTARLYPRVAGQIVGRDGKPVAHARVAPMCDAFRVRHMGQTVSTSHGGLDGTTTDAEGLFVLQNVPKSLVYLRIDGEDLVPLEYGRFAADGSRAAGELPRDTIENLRITVGRRCHFQVELADPSFADEIAVLDDAGEALELSVFAGTGRSEGLRLPLRGGRSEVIACPDNGVMVVLRKGRVEVSRRKLELKVGELTSVRF
jgi:protocatechuate 3,4-dioxygenase beta subunit